MSDKELETKLMIILADYFDDINALKKRDGELPAQAAVARIRTLITTLCNETRVEELSNIRENLDMTVTYWRTLGKAGAVPAWMPKLDEFYTEWVKELDDRIKALKGEK